MNPQNVISNSNEYKNYILSWLPEPLLKIDPTIVASSLSVLALMLLGSCIWCYAYLRRKTKKGVASALDSTNSTPNSESNKIEQFFEGWKAEQNFGGGENQKMMNGSSGKNSIGRGIYKNIITPDKSIPFIIPTIPLPAQPISLDREIRSELPTCSKTLSLSQSSIPTEYYPQLVQGGEEQHPKIGFSLYYEAATQILHVRLLGGRFMPENIRHCISVKLYPGRGGKQKTPEFEEVSPIYNQEFSFHIRKSTLCTRVLRFKAIILETPKKLIGSLNLALKELPGFEVEDAPTDLQSTHVWKFLENSAEVVGEGIRLRVSVQWQEEPPPGLLTLKIIEATGLHEIGGNDYTSSHVKVTLQEQGRFIKSRKTRLVRWGSVPVYDDVFVVTIPQDLLSQISFRLEVIARGRLGSKVVLGKISIGSMPYASSSTEGMDFWEDMCHQPNTEIFRWMQLVA